jgi:hypothetical protein
VNPLIAERYSIPLETVSRYVEKYSCNYGDTGAIIVPAE